MSERPPEVSHLNDFLRSAEGAMAEKARHELSRLYRYAARLWEKMEAMRAKPTREELIDAIVEAGARTPCRCGDTEEPTCFGRVDGDYPGSYGCDNCCGHEHEPKSGGWCIPVRG